MTYYIIIGLIAVLGIWVVGSYVVIMNIEEPSYTVLEQNDGYEIRQYESYIVAKTTVQGTFSESLNSGFSIIADYIFGNNTAKSKIAMTAPVLEGNSEKIAMTAPVINTMDSPQERTVSFVLPSKYTLETLPEPNNKEVTLLEVPARKVAVRRFTWYVTEKRIATQTAILEAKLTEDNIRALSTPQVAQYNPPLSFPLTRRNEIMITVE